MQGNLQNMSVFCGKTMNEWNSLNLIQRTRDSCLLRQSAQDRRCVLNNYPYYICSHRIPLLLLKGAHFSFSNGKPIYKSHHTLILGNMQQITIWERFRKCYLIGSIVWTDVYFWNTHYIFNLPPIHTSSFIVLSV